MARRQDLQRRKAFVSQPKNLHCLPTPQQGAHLACLLVAFPSIRGGGVILLLMGIITLPPTRTRITGATMHTEQCRTSGRMNGRSRYGRF